MRQSACVPACADTVAAPRLMRAGNPINAEQTDAPDTGTATTSQPDHTRS